MTVAGQTAPSPGITIIRGGIEMVTHDILLQHIRVRPGDAEQPKKSGWEPEVTTNGPECYNIVVDHCSISWSVDENLSASGPRYNGPNGTTHNVTYSNNIVAEGLYDSSHSKGIHSMGSLIHDNCRNIAIIGNLYAHNNERNPYFKAFTTGVIVNNVVYNPGDYAIEVDWLPQEWASRNIQPENARVSVVGNVVIYGVNTVPGLAAVSPMGDVYLEDNIATNIKGHHVALTGGQITILKEKPVWPEGLKALPARNTAAWVTAHSGARPKDRDDVDKRIIREFQERKGHFINSQEEVGGYPKVAPTSRKLDVPKDNIDAWLAKLAHDLEY
ncbi:MAG: right-handed parallel beta-helix repeat-containing protein [Bryobacteraceae bacterium]